MYCYVLHSEGIIAAPAKPLLAGQAECEAVSCSQAQLPRENASPVQSLPTISFAY